MHRILTNMSHRHFFFHPVPALLLLATLSITGCKKGAEVVASSSGGEEPTLTAADPMLILHPAGETGLRFVNEIEESFESNPTNNINIYNGGGVAVADINLDGLPDLYFINCSGKNGLFLNQGNFKFKNITDGSGMESADGFETSVTVTDINNDGLPDFYVGRAGPYPPEKCKNRLFVNNGDLTFSERAAEYGLDVDTRTTGANFFDYDLDGDLDVYILNYPQSFDFTSKIEARLDEKTGKYVPELKPKTPYDSDRLYRNNGNGSFTDVSKAAGINNFAYGLSVTVSDLNNDGWPDIYVGNDFIQPDIVYINNKNGSFSNRTENVIRHSTQHTMGVDIADFDNDLLVDFVGVDMLPEKHFRQKSTMNTNSQNRHNTVHEHGYFHAMVRNVLQRNNGNGTFSDVACLANVYKTDWSWSSLFMDINNDGLKDLAITNGYRREVTDMDFVNFTFAEIKKGGDIRKQFAKVQDLLELIPTYKIRNYVFQNNGDWTFDNMAGKWLTVPASWSNGAAYADFDRDGDLDWVMNNLEDEPFLYENRAAQKSGNNYLQIELQGDAPNRMAVGASVLIRHNGKQQYQELYPTRGIFSSVEHLIHFGLGKDAQADELTVQWPNGKTTALQNVKANQRLVLKQSEATGRSAGPRQTPKGLFVETTARSGVNFTHTENEYLDFDFAFLQPWKASELGPMIAKGDVNGDGLEDFYAGNAFGKPAALYLQTPDGRFKPNSMKTWEQDMAYEDHGAVFFDADTDGDLDLFVVSGGYEADRKFANMAWINRLYINLDGKGNFARATDAIPTLQDVGGRVAVHDFNQDGKPDLFIGGRLKPGAWPLTPRSAVLRNDGNRFTDVTAAVAPEFEFCGMVTDLCWANLDGDPTPELVVAGEWMPIMVFKLENGQLKNQTANFGLAQSNGLWNRLLARDLDGDGDLDLLAGNWGLNTRLTAAGSAPLRCYARDFDGNGSVDPILTYVQDDKEYPLMRQDAMIKQIPALKKRFIYAKVYGAATIDDIYPAKERQSGVTLAAYTLANSWWENKNGKLIQHVLPLPAQTAPGLALEVADFNGDGFQDLLLGGNKYGVEVETGRCDAGIGALLLGDGKGKFQYLPNVSAGIWIPGEVRDLACLKGKNNRITLVVGNNNAKMQVFSVAD